MILFWENVSTVILGLHLKLRTSLWEHVCISECCSDETLQWAGSGCSLDSRLQTEGSNLGTGLARDKVQIPSLWTRAEIHENWAAVACDHTAHAAQWLPIIKTFKTHLWWSGCFLGGEDHYSTCINSPFVMFTIVAFWNSSIDEHCTLATAARHLSLELS